MINVSNEFRQLMSQNTDFKQNAEITFANGDFLELSEKDFIIENNSVVDAGESSGIPLGVAISRSIQIELMNDDDRFSDYDFFGAEIRLYLTFKLSDTVERIEYGTFTVLTPETYGTTVIITAVDDMHKADADYHTSLSFPATIGAMLRDACTTIGISQGTTTFLNDDFIVEEKPEGITFRQMFGYIAMIAGGNARIDLTGRLRIITYDFSVLDNIRDSIVSEDYDENSYHVLENWKDLKIDTDDVVITGVQTSYTDNDNNEKTALYGYEGYVLKIENPLIAGKEQTAVNLIGNVMVGGRFRQFSGDYIAYPIAEFMDAVVLIDRKKKAYASFITDINFQFFGFTTLKNSAEPALRNSAKTYSDATQTLVKSRNLIKNERLAREKAVEQLAKDLQNSSGLFMTEEKQEDGSTIYYMHDKPTLSESMIVWKLTSLAFAISNDGGQTYPYGFTVDGTTITRLLYAEGIDADYINTGALRIEDGNGNTIFLADYDTKKVEIKADNVKIGAESIVDKFSDQEQEISNLQNQIDGNITTYNLNYVPTLTNYPAWDWAYNIPCNDTVQASDTLQLIYKDEYWRRNARSVVFNTETFVTYRFLEKDGVWGWVEIADSEYSYVLQRVSELEMSDEAITASVKELEQEIIADYMTKKDAQSLVTQTATEIRTEVSNTYETKSNASSSYKGLESKISQTAESIRSEVSNTYETKDSASSQYSKLSSSITQTASSIRSEVSSTYETKNNATSQYGKLSSSISQTADEITAEVKRATAAEGSLSARININAQGISSKVSIGSVSSEISQEAGKISIKSDRLSIESSKFSLSEDGTIKATAGTIANLAIEPHHLYWNYGNTSAGMSDLTHGSAFWAGASFANKDNAPFRVWHDGTVICQKLEAAQYTKTNDLEAVVARFGYATVNELEANYVNTNTFNAAVGRISRLEANSITADTLESSIANIRTTRVQNITSSGIANFSWIQYGNYHFVVRYSSTLGGYVVMAEDESSTLSLLNESEDI